MRERRNGILTAVSLTLGLILGGACSREAPAGKPAGVPPLASGAMAPGAAAPPLPTAPSLPTAPPPLPAPSPAGKQALEGALGIEAPPPVEAEAVPGVLDESQTISGTIVLPAANRAKVQRGDVMFLAARRAGGPPGPGSMLAVQKLSAETFPMRFAISNRDAMIPGIPFEGQMSITVRVDKDGDAMTRRKGDVYGQADNVKVGSQKVVVSLDRVQTEDKTLGEPGPAVGGMMPAGHP